MLAGSLSLSCHGGSPSPWPVFLAQQETKRAGRKTLDKTVVGSLVRSFRLPPPLSFSLFLTWIALLSALAGPGRETDGRTLTLEMVIWRNVCLSLSPVKVSCVVQTRCHKSRINATSRCFSLLFIFVFFSFRCPSPCAFRSQKAETLKIIKKRDSDFCSVKVSYTTGVGGWSRCHFVISHQSTPAITPHTANSFLFRFFELVKRWPGKRKGVDIISIFQALFLSCLSSTLIYIDNSNNHTTFDSTYVKCWIYYTPGPGFTMFFSDSQIGKKKEKKIFQKTFWAFFPSRENPPSPLKTHVEKRNVWRSVLAGRMRNLLPDAHLPAN